MEVQRNNNLATYLWPSGSGKSTLSANLSTSTTQILYEDVAYIQNLKINTALWMHQNL